MSSQNRTNIPNSLNEHWMPFSDNRNFKKNPRLSIISNSLKRMKPERKEIIFNKANNFIKEKTKK